jgi:hypothetical protein
MTQPDVRPALAEEMAAHGRPVPAERLERAKRTLAAAAQRRDPALRAAAKDLLSRPASAA